MHPGWTSENAEASCSQKVSLLCIGWQSSQQSAHANLKLKLKLSRLFTATASNSPIREAKYQIFKYVSRAGCLFRCDPGNSCGLIAKTFTSELVTRKPPTETRGKNQFGQRAQTFQTNPTDPHDKITLVYGMDDPASSSVMALPTRASRPTD